MKILAVVDNDLYFRNFVLSGALDKVRQNHKFLLALSDAVVKLRSSTPLAFNIANYKRNEENKDHVKVFNQISMRYFKGKSSTFAIKTQKYKAGFRDELFFNIFSKPFSFQWAKRIILSKIKRNKGLEKVVRAFKPDLVLFPTSGYEATGMELILMSKKYEQDSSANKFKTFFLTNGWDNLSSKGVMLLNPDYLGLWGPQALIDAVTIHGMKDYRCFLLGCSRYESYFSSNKTTKIFPFKYILFAGSTTATDEITPLKVCDEVLSRLKTKNIKIVYRPHPMRAKRVNFDYFEKNEYKNVVIDPQLEESYYEDKKTGRESGAAQNFPDLNYYPSLLKNALFIVSPLSSMLVEAGIFDVPALVLAHKDSNPIPASLQARWRHFEGAEEIPGWFFAHDLNQIKNTFKTLLMKFKNESAKNRGYNGILSSAIKKYLYFDSRFYKDRLDEAISIIFSS